MANGQEKEIKLTSTKAAWKKFFQLPLVKEKILAGSPHTLKLWNQYLDTRDRKLSRTGMAYRIRRTNGKAFEATIKSRGETVNGFSRRAEYTVPLEQAKPVLQGFAPQVDQKLQTLLQEDELLPLCTVEFTRKMALLQLSAVTVVEASVDTGTIRAGGKEALIGEIELELKRGQERELLRFTAELAQAIPLLPEERSKFSRGLALLDGETPKAKKKMAAPAWTEDTDPLGLWRSLAQKAAGTALDLLVPRMDEAFDAQGMLVILRQLGGLWLVGQDFLSRNTWKKGKDLLAGLQEQLEPMACLTGFSDAKAKPFPEELLSLEPGRKWLEDQWVAAAQKAAEACRKEVRASLWQLLYLCTLAHQKAEVPTLGVLLQRQWNAWQQEQQLLADAGSPDPWERKDQMEKLEGLLALTWGLGEKRLQKRGRAYENQWWKHCLSYARTGALEEGAEQVEDRELSISLAALCGQEGLRTEKHRSRAWEAGKDFFKEVARHKEWSCL